MDRFLADLKQTKIMDRFNSNEEMEATPLSIAKDIIYSDGTMDEKVKQIESAITEAKNLAISVVSPRFFAFAEWAAGNYIRLHGTWVHKFADQRKKENYINTEQLWEKYNIIFPNEG